MACAACASRLLAAIATVAIAATDGFTLCTFGRISECEPDLELHGARALIGVCDAKACAARDRECRPEVAVCIVRQVLNRVRIGRTRELHAGVPPGDRRPVPTIEYVGAQLNRS